MLIVVVIEFVYCLVDVYNEGVVLCDKVFLFYNEVFDGV